MAVPKGFKKDINLIPDHIGPRRREEMVSIDIAKGGTFLPRGVMYEDIDKTFIEFIGKDLSLTIDGAKVPVIFLTIQRWAEYARTWEFTDEYKNIKLPFVTIVRKPDIQVGTNQNSLWNIPGHPTYNYYRVPTFNGGREGVDIYKVPQPTSVDITYEVRIFCGKMRDLNRFNLKVIKAFRARQFYISPNGHPMPVHLESVGDESQIDDFQARRFYAQLFEMKLLGYVLDEEDFEVTPAIDRSLVTVEVLDTDKTPIYKIETCGGESTTNLNVISKPFAQTHFKITAQFDAYYFDLTDIQNVTGVTFKINGVPKTIPFSINSGEELEVRFNKSNALLGKFTIKGNLK